VGGDYAAIIRFKIAFKVQLMKINRETSDFFVRFFLGFSCFFIQFLVNSWELFVDTVA
jgi:hypothetical protein